jgi:hypothetical protein
MGNGWNFNGSAANESALKPLCQHVDKYFSRRKLHRYFAVIDDPYLTSVGPYYRGFHAHASAKAELPLYLQREMDSFDHMIYIRQSTGPDPTSCVITYAHERQHIEQFGRYPKVLKANNVLRENLKTFKPTASEIDLPTEVEANIVSKRIAESVCGTEVVRNFAEEQVRHMDQTSATEQKARWEFFLKVPSSSTYDPVKATVRLVEEYKYVLNFGMDVDVPKWWLRP